MTVGIDISQIVHPGTGVGTYTRNLVHYLLAKPEGISYVLFGSSFRKKVELERFAQHLYADNLDRFKKQFLLLPPSVMELLWNRLHVLPIDLFLEDPPDVFHSSDWTQPPTKAKKITTIHDMIVYRYPESSHPAIIAAQKRRLGWVKKECDLIIADSHSTKSDIQELLDITSDRIRVIHLAAGSDYANFRLLSETHQRTEEDKVRAKYGLPRRYVLAVGTREPRKNLDRLIQAYSRLAPKDTDLVIAGKFGWGDNNFQFKISNLKLLDYVPQEDLPALFSAAFTFVYPSLYEGFGVPVLEAMTVGTPVITSNISSLPEVGGNAAVYVDPGNTDDIAEKLDYVLKFSTTRRQQMVKKGREQASHFSWEKTAPETIAAYKSLV